MRRVTIALSGRDRLLSPTVYAWRHSTLYPVATLNDHTHTHTHIIRMSTAQQVSTIICITSTIGVTYVMGLTSQLACHQKYCIFDEIECSPSFRPSVQRKTTASRNKYVVVGLGGATMRMGARLDSPVLKTLPQGTVRASTKTPLPLDCEEEELYAQD